MPIVPGRYYQRLGEVLAAEGVDPLALLREAGIDPADLARPEATLTLAQVEAVIAAMARLRVRSDIAFELGRRLKVSAHSIVGYGMLSSPTLGEALRFVARYFRLVMPTFDMRYRYAGEAVELAFTPVAAQSPACLHFHIEAIAVAAHFEVRDLLEGAMPPHQLLLSMAEPPHAQRYRTLAESDVIFHAEGPPGGCLRLPAEVDQRPLRMADSHALSMAEARCAELLGSAVSRGRVSDWVRMMLRESADGMPTAPELARILNISARTLDRHLKREGNSYRELLAETRQALACRMLRESTLSITRIALELGYSDAANFSRAFRRARGCSPQAWRQANSEGDSAPTFGGSTAGGRDG